MVSREANLYSHVAVTCPVLRWQCQEKAHHFAPDMFLFLANGRTERGHRYIAFPGLPAPCHPPPLPSLNPLPSCPSKIKSRPTVLAKTYRAPPLKTPPVPSTIASGVLCRERKDGGSAGSGVHLPLSSLPVSLRWTSGPDICAISLLTFRNAGLNLLVFFIPLAWASHFHEWAHGLTFARMS
jgi:hypothetical protein